MKQFPVVALGDVLRQRKEFITIDDTQQYKRCRVQLHARGVVLRDLVLGSDIKTKKQQVCRASEFLVAEIDAKVGGFGLVPDELDGAVVSSHYFLFEIDRTVLDPRYLDHYCRTERFRAQVEAQGSTNYAAIRPTDVLAYTIPLPPLPEQKAIVARLDALAEKTRQVEVHLEAIERDAERLLRAYIFHPPGEQPAKRPMSELVSQRQPDVTVDRTAQYRFAGVYSFGRGVFPSVVKTGSEFAYERLSTVRAGDFTYPKLMAWEGALGVVPPECDGMVVSPEFPVFSINTDEVLPELLDIYFRTSEVWPDLAELSGGTNVRRRRLQPSAFLTYEIPVPSMATQLKLREVFRRTQALKAKHAAIRQANAALIPATLERIFSSEVTAHA
ncbi:MAG: restriction endonuclease subunit S [Thiobacillaceae bacterium]